MLSTNGTRQYHVTLKVLVGAMASLAGIIALSVTAPTSKAAEITGDADRGADQFEATCSECHGPAATAPTLRGIINREVAGDRAFTGYSDAMKAKKPMKWTKQNLSEYLISPNKFVPGSYMNREFPDAQLRADVIAFLETLPPPREN